RRNKLRDKNEFIDSYTNLFCKPLNAHGRVPSNSAYKGFEMKKLVLIFALGLGLASASTYGYQHEDERGAYSHDNRDAMERHVNHVNRMLEHVRWQLRRY